MFSQEGLFQLLRPEEDGAVVILEGVGLVVGLVVGLLHDRIEDALDDGPVGLGLGVLRIGQGREAGTADVGPGLVRVHQAHVDPLLGHDGLELVGRIGNESPEARKWVIFKRN